MVPPGGIVDGAKFGAGGFGFKKVDSATIGGTSKVIAVGLDARGTSKDARFLGHSFTDAEHGLLACKEKELSAVTASS